MKQLYALLLLTLLSQITNAQKVLFLYNEAGLRVRRGTEVALPVTLVRFTAEKVGREMGYAVQLRWETSAEVNSERFEIERSGDAKQWSQLSAVAATGEPGKTERYTFLDEMPLTGRSYYRLRMVDQDGTFAFSQVREVLIDGAVALYPNPVTDRLFVPGEADEPVQVYNMKGQLVLEQHTETDRGIDVSRLPAGPYLLRSGSNPVGRKFVKR